jgi:hypothetical protein
MSDVLYLYGFVRTTDEAPPRALTGVSGAYVRLLELDGVVAAVSDVSSDEFSPDGIDAHIQDLNWVGARGLEHERVVAWFVDHAEILPVSLFTMYSGEDALRREIRSRIPGIQDAMQRLAGHREWDLKVAYDDAQLKQHAAAVSDAVRAIEEEIAGAAPGRRFLLEKKRRDILKTEISGAARAEARALLDVLAVHAADAITLPMPRNEELPVVMNAALLVEKRNENALRDAAAEPIGRLEKLGIHARLTGPWAPYRFTESTDGTA